MGKISEIKMRLRHKEWAEMVQECRASGKRVDVWCRENGIKVSTYYKRLNVLRRELIENSNKQSIVPVSVSTAISVQHEESQPISSDTSEAVGNKIIMRKDGIEIELPQSITEDTILALLRGLKKC